MEDISKNMIRCNLHSHGQFLQAQSHKAFIRPMMEYGNVAIIGASATLLSRLDTVQNAAATLCHVFFIPLQHRRHAATVGLLLKLLGCHCHELLQTFYPNFPLQI